MKAKPVKLSDQYCSALESYLSDGGETALLSAYEIGRNALNQGLGVLEMASLHHEALKRLITSWVSAEDAAKKAGNIERFFVESLTPFEMTHRGFREANQALRESEERYRELFENANDIVFTTDLKGNFTSINKAGERATGYGRDEAPSKTFAEVVPPEYSDVARRMIERKTISKTPTTHELELLSRDGRRVPLEVSTRLILHENTPVGVQGIARDITERRRAQDALRKSNEALEEQAKNIAHALHDDAGQLLATIHIALEDAIREVLPKNRKHLEKIRGILYEIEEHLRRFSHELRPTVLDDLGLQAGLEFLANNVSKRTGIFVKFENSVDGRLPAPVETALYRITQEALTNITRHAKAKNAFLKLHANGKKISYSIRDDGVGFDAGSELARRGQRGLGLVGIQMRLDAFGGSFSIKSAPEKGSELFITIPLER
jgi:two-component system, NarL family, sensor histidine kinase UhpB